MTTINPSETMVVSWTKTLEVGSTTPPTTAKTTTTNASSLSGVSMVLIVERSSLEAFIDAYTSRKIMYFTVRHSDPVMNSSNRMKQTGSRIELASRVMIPIERG